MSASAQTATNTNSYLTIFELGDSSCDGHCRLEKHMYITNLSEADFLACYSQSVQKTGIQFMDVVADEYGDSTIKMDQWNKIKSTMTLSQSLISEVESEGEEDSDIYPLNEETYLGIAFAFAANACPRFTASAVKNGSVIPASTVQSIYAGGYGLFDVN